jgi:glycosyltransferase involved in cell wall biosynthesis
MKDGVGPEVISHGVDGLLCDTRDPSELAGTILQALMSPELRRTIGVKARHSAQSKFSLDKATSENIALYEDLVEKAQHA